MHKPPKIQTLILIPALVTAITTQLCHAAPAVQGHIVVFERDVSRARVVDAFAQFPAARVERAWDQAINGVLVTGLSTSDIDTVRGLHGVRTIAPDTAAQLENLPAPSPSKSVQVNPPLGLDRIDQRGPVLDAQYHYPDLSSTKYRATVYVLDSGLFAAHEDFSGPPSARDPRAQLVYSAFPGDPSVDDTGHGTHVAGIIAGTRYGVAKQSLVKGLRVCKQTRCQESDLLSGLDWVASHYRAPAVVNMSIDLKYRSAAVADAIQTLHGLGIFVVSAAGNSPVNACTDPNGVAYPANVAPGNHVIAASDRDRLWASFGVGTGYGPCIFISAPGVGIRSAAPDGGSAGYSGTSQATPHVAGVAALIMQAAPNLTPDQVAAEILRRATQPLPNFWNGSQDFGHTTPNRLLYALPN